MFKTSGLLNCCLRGCTTLASWIIYFVVVAHLLSLIWQFKKINIHRLITGQAKIGIYTKVNAVILTIVLGSHVATTFLSTWQILIGCHSNPNSTFYDKIIKILFSAAYSGEFFGPWNSIWSFVFFRMRYSIRLCYFECPCFLRSSTQTQPASDDLFS